MKERYFELELGQRIRLSALGRERCPKLRSHTGVVAGKADYSSAVQVLLDGYKTPLTLHTSYIEVP
jgi:hypothetical protein